MKFDSQDFNPLRTILFGLMGLMVSPVVAQENSEDWTTPLPAALPTKFDWVQLPSSNGLGVSGLTLVAGPGTFAYKNAVIAGA